MAGLTLQQIQQMGGTPVTPQAQPAQGLTADQLKSMGAQPVENKGVIGTIGSNLGNTFKQGGESVVKDITNIIPDAQNAGGGVTATMASVGQGLGHVAGDIARTTGGIIGSFIEPVLPQGVKDTLGNITQHIDNALSSIPGMTPDIQKGIGDVFNTFTLKGGKATTPIVKEGLNTATDVASQAIKQTIKDVTTPIADMLPKVSPEVADMVIKRGQALQQIYDNNGPIRRVVNDAKTRGVDVQKIVADTDLLNNAVDETGNLSTLHEGGAVPEFNKFMNQYESATSDALAREGKSVPLSEVQKAFDTNMSESRLAGSSKVRLTNLFNQEMDGLKLDVDANGMISLKKLQDAKISTTNGVDYTKPETKINAKTIGSVYKTLIEKNSSLPVAEINAELSKYYKIGDYLESLNGKKVQGGKLGKYFAQTVGGIAGSHFGPLGTIIGAELASKIKGTMMSSTFGGEVGKSLEATDLLKNTVENNKQPRIGLPAPQAGAPRTQIGSGPTINLPQENSFGNLNKTQPINTMNTNTVIQDTLPQSTPKVKLKVDKSVQSSIPKADTLTQEAQKYKSAEEFVKAQPTVYHGSQTELKQFNNKQGTFFTDNYPDATGYSGGMDNVYEGVLDFKKPLTIDAKGAKWDELNTKYGKSTQEIIGKAQKDGYDGVIFKNIVDNVMDTAGMGESTVYYAYKPRASFLNESQLTDIWNKANKK